ncbi:AMP-dependent synthetase/ligase [Streptomyces sp. WMMC1477]|uniref:AMP-dependent synthetase/ligase n=1 Tax=Streptomyces sp. WMMC1477 TaxID=3015155 RepID=UPI0022B5F426|nr:long-chain fatty acid--CoA ligase [Streptomyces sp. WMMC1477]MCZ7434374.1 long-chain fatty acid--CoA ligase [Streptomyces sp. WMMC1477]
MREISVPPVASKPPVGGLADCLFERAEAAPNAAVLARKGTDGRWRDVTAAAFREEVTAVAKGLLAEGVRFGDRVALMCRTRYEWTLLDFALWSVGAQPVPVYPTSSAEQVSWILHDADVSAVIVEDEGHAMTVGSVIDRLPGLRRLWQLDAGLEQHLVRAGAQLPDSVVERHRMALTPDTPATILYTSGTTGRPRGCVLSHGNFMAECDNMLGAFEKVIRPRPAARPATLLFLPLSHVFGRMVQVAALRSGVKLGHQPALSAAELLPDLAAFRPDFFLAVPYVLERLFHAARRRAERDGRLNGFDRAVQVAVRYAEAVEARAFGEGPGPSTALRLQHRFFDRVVYSRFRAALGGRCASVMSGGSALERRLGLFFDGAGIRVYEGYGLTETTGATVANPPRRTRFGTVGRPIPGTSVHVADDGEIWLRGAQVFQGYHDDPRGTGASLYEGWLATGDVGRLDEHGYLTITGRKKDILVTSGGKSVSPGPLEDRVRAHPLVAHCVLVGNDRPYVAALVTLDAEAVAHWLAMRNGPALAPEQAVRSPELEAEVQRAVLAANSAVSQAESIRAFRVLAARFTEESGLLTPSLKVRRAAVEHVFAAEIEELYRSRPPRPRAGADG